MFGLCYMLDNMEMSEYCFEKKMIKNPSVILYFA
jgi:hypothetical protein